MWLRFSFVFLTLLLHHVSPDIYTSTFSIMRAFRRERQIVESSAQLVKKIDNADKTYNYRRFERFVKATSAIHQVHRSYEEIEAFLQHPINSYHFIKRCAKDWSRHMINFQFATNKLIRDFCWKLQTGLRDDHYWPESDDLTGVSVGILRLHETYSLDLGELATGTLLGTKTDPLTVEDFYDIAMVAVDHWMSRSALHWLEKALEISQGDQRASSDVTSFKIKMAIAELYEKHGDYVNAVKTSQALTQSDPDSVTLDQLHSYYINESVTHPSIGLFNAKVYEDTYPKYKELCRGDVMHELNERKIDVTGLECFYQPTPIPYYPAKVERLNSDPEVRIFHDVIFPQEIKYIKRAVGHKLERSKINHGGKGTTSKVRISKTAWLDTFHPQHETLGGVIHRIGRITGLDSMRYHNRSLEQIQVVNYGLGGFYGPHLDLTTTAPGQPQNFQKSPNGDRIATCLLYLNDVYHGGATVFPTLGVRAPIVKGAALFWWNVFKNGTGDGRTWHGGCPVNIGSKWIANLWYRFTAQFQARPCSTNQFE